MTVEMHRVSGGNEEALAIRRDFIGRRDHEPNPLIGLVVESDHIKSLMPRVFVEIQDGWLAEVDAEWCFVHGPSHLHDVVSR